MSFRNPSYITTNRLGIYQFQIRNPAHFRHTKPLYRKSLNTRNRGEALSTARRLVIMFDEMKARFFEDEESYNKAMNILDQYDVKAVGDWQTVEEFLMTLGDWQSHLLEQAIDYRKVSSKWAGAQPISPNPAQQSELGEQIETIQKTLSILSQNHTPLTSKPLSELLQIYINEKSEGWNDKNIETNTKDVKPKLELFTQHVNDINGDDIAPDHIVNYKSFLFRLPSNRTKGSYKDKTVIELAEMDIPKNERISVNTVINYANKLSTFLQWMEKNHYCRKKLYLSLRGIEAPDVAEHEERPTWTDSELTRLFNSVQYTEKGHRQPSHYWVPLLALYTGARQGELCQLYKDDIYRDKDTGIWVISFNAKLDKKLKKPYHARIVPLNPQLKKMGFLDYLDSFEHERCFPDLPKKRDGYGQKFSRWFCDTYINRNNCNTRKSTSEPDGVFHSFRHTFITKLDHEHNVPPHQTAHIVGQKPEGNSVTTSRYIKPHELRQREKIISKLVYPSIDFKAIRPWQRGFKPWNGKLLN